MQRTRRRSALVRALAVPALAVPALAGALIAAAPVQADTGLGLGRADVLDDGTAQVVATAPDALTGRDLTGAFTAMAAGRGVPLQATRALTTSGLVLALDTSAGSEQLLAEQSAGADLLRMLPPTTATTVLPGGRRGTALEALAALATLRPSAAGLLDGLPPAAAGRGLAVVITGCPALGRETRALPDDTQVSVLAVGAGCGAGASRLAGRAPGVVRTGLDTGRLFAAVDETGRTLLGQYVLKTTAPVPSGPLEVTLTDGGTTVRASTVLPDRGARPSASAAGSTDDAPAWSVVLAVALAVAAAGSLGLELLARRRLRATG